MSLLRILSFIIIISYSLTDLAGQTHRPAGLRENTPEVFAFIHANIIAQPGVLYENATLVIRDGLIEALGTNVTIPDDAWIVDLKDKFIYPGFIETYSHIGLPSAKEVSEREKNMPNQGRHWNNRIRSNYSSAVAYQYDEKLSEVMRSQGFVVAHTVPETGIFSGFGSIVKLSDDTPAMQIIKPELSQAISFLETGTREYPTSVMGAIALIRQSFYDAQWYKDVHEHWQKNPASNSQPEFNMALAAITQSLDNKLPFVFKTDDEQYLLQSIKITREFNLNSWFVGSGYEYRRAEAFNGFNSGLILPLSFPDAPDVSTPEKSLNISLEQLRHWYLAPENPSILNNNGIRFSLSSYGLAKPETFLLNLRKAVERGLPEEIALAALTITPSKMMGIDKVYGSIEKGKSASFIISDGNIFRSGGKIEQVWINGEKHDITKDKEWLAGQWKTTDLAPGNELLISISITDLKTEGLIKSENSNTSKKLESLKIENSRISFRISKDSIWQGMSISASFSETSMLGIGESDNGRIFSWTATKASKLADNELETKSEKKEEKSWPALPERFPSMEYGIALRPDLKQFILVKNATIWTQGPEGKLENADMLVKEGMVIQLGQNIQSPAGATVVDATGKHITPGLVDPHLHTSIVGEVNETGDAITSETRITDVIDANNVWIYRLLAGGLTTANLFHGSANPVGGQSAMIKMRWGELPDELVVKDAKPGLKFALGENVKRMPDRYPNTRMGAEQIIKDSFLAALQYEKSRQSSFDSRGRQIKPFRRDLQLDPILEVLQNKRMAHVHAYRQDEMLMMMRLAEEFGFKVASFEHTVEGYKIADELREHGAAAIVWTDWSSFKIEAYDAIKQNARLLLDAGVLTSLHSDNTQLSTRMHWEAGKILGSGVDEVNALNLITINPAKLLRIDNRVGSLEPGKDADFVIWNGHPLSAFTIAEQTWIEGLKYFDRNEDLKIQESIRNERTFIIRKISENNK